MSGGVQLPFDGLPIDPVEVARPEIFDRARLYSELGLAPEQRETVEAAVRLIAAGGYGGRRAG